MLFSWGSRNVDWGVILLKYRSAQAFHLKQKILNCEFLLYPYISSEFHKIQWKNNLYMKQFTQSNPFKTRIAFLSRKNMPSDQKSYHSRNISPSESTQEHIKISSSSFWISDML